MPPVILLIIAIASEVAGTLALKASDGFSRPLPSIVVVVAYLISFWMLALVLQHISIGTTYAVWAGAGTAAIALIGMAALGEPASALKLGSVGLIVAGVVGLNLAGAAH